MSKIWKSVTVLCGATMLALGIALPSAAGCVDPPSILSQRTLMPLLQLAGTGAPALAKPLAAVAADSDEDLGIVGLWQFAFISEGNNVDPFDIKDGDQLDAGYTQWHSDQTEIMNSGRAP